MVRYASLALILIVAFWLLRPPEEAASPEAAAGAQATPTPIVAGDGVKYVIRFSPNSNYMPGTRPSGIGEPLHGLSDVIREFEARFPDTRVEIVTVPRLREYLVTQLSGGQAPDIIEINVEDVWTDIQKGWYVPIDRFLEAPNLFIRERNDSSLPGYNAWWDQFRYQTISRGKAAPDGYNYCLTFDMVETGFFYNKTVFNKLGLRPPADWEELMAICDTLRKAGYTPLLLNIDSLSDWGTDLIFDQIYSCLLPGIDLFKDPKREPFLQGYLDWDEIAFLFRQGFFAPEDPRWREVWRFLHILRDQANRDLLSTDVNRAFINQKGAMIWTACPFTYRLVADRDLGFEWGVFYMPRFTKKTTPLASEVDMCIIGEAAVQYEVTNSALRDVLNPEAVRGKEDILKALEDMGTERESKRLRRVIEFMQWMCVPENYERIVNEYICLVSNIEGVKAPPELRPFEEFLKRRYTTTKWIFTFDLKFTEVQRRLLELYLNDAMTLDEFLEGQKANLDYAVNNLIVRKNPDMAPLQAEWDRLASVRATMPLLDFLKPHRLAPPAERAK